MNLDNNLSLEKLKASGIYRRATLQLGIYAQHLGSANGLQCKTLKVDTIKRYIQNVSDFVTNFGTPPVTTVTKRATPEGAHFMSPASQSWQAGKPASPCPKWIVTAMPRQR